MNHINLWVFMCGTRVKHAKSSIFRSSIQREDNSCMFQILDFGAQCTCIQNQTKSESLIA